MPTELISEKVQNLQSQINTMKLEIYLLNFTLVAADAMHDPGPEGDPAALAAYNQLKSEAVGVRARAIYLQAKLTPMQSALDALTKEQKPVKGV